MNHPNSLILLITGLAIALSASACKRAEPVSFDDREADFSTIQAQIFSQSCALSGCHAGDSAPLGLDLTEEEAYDNLVNVSSREVPNLLRVEPGNAEDSYLIIKVRGGNRMAEGTSRMPLGRSPLSEEDIQLIEEWIDDGAPR